MEDRLVVDIRPVSLSLLLLLPMKKVPTRTFHLLPVVKRKWKTRVNCCRIKKESEDGRNERNKNYDKRNKRRNNDDWRHSGRH